MNLFRLFFELLLIYIVYKVVFELVIPLYQGTRIMQKKMDQFKESAQQEPRKEKEKPATHDDDYIDYEEIK